MDISLFHTLHPLAATLKRVTVVDENAYADIGSLEAGWFLAADLLVPRLTRLEEALARQAVQHPEMEARTRGSYFLGEYSWYVPDAVIAAYLAERRVPDLSLKNLALRSRTYTWHEGAESGEAERIDMRLLNGRFACLPDDPAAAHPDATVLPDADALHEHLRVSLEAHLTPLIERVHLLTRLGHHAQWCLVADSVAALFLHKVRALNDEAGGKAEGLAFIKAAEAPMNNPNTSYISLHYLDHRATFRARGGCCRYYTVSKTGKDYCSTCVLRKPEDRDARLLAYMQQKYAKAAL